jgi:hypothetical protein
MDVPAAIAIRPRGRAGDRRRFGAIAALRRRPAEVLDQQGDAGERPARRTQAGDPRQPEPAGRRRQLCVR